MPRLVWLVIAVAVLDLALVAAEEPSLDSPDSSPLSDDSAGEEQPPPPPPPPQLQVGTSGTREADVDLNRDDKNLFQRLFIERRKEHLQAIKNLKSISNYERQYKMIKVLSQKMFDVIESKKYLLENFTESELDNLTFSTSTNKNNDVKDAMSSILENIAFFGDIVLNLPDITHRILKTKPQWNSTIRWSFNFLNQTKIWIDDSTLAMVNLALQELDIIPKEANYLNSNRIVESKVDKTKMKKERPKRGPKMTKIEL